MQPGQNLWRMARRAYGSGLRYTVIFLANKDQIRDASLIYPGQVFAVPAPCRHAEAGAALLAAAGAGAITRRLMTIAQTLRSVFAPPHRAGRPFIAGGLVAALVGLFVSRWLVWPAALFTLFCLYFFRDPERTPPARPGAVWRRPMGASSR